MAFKLPDGLVYTWNGCGGPTWITWLDPSTDIAKGQFFGNCDGSAQNYKCGETLVQANYLCMKPQG